MLQVARPRVLVGWKYLADGQPGVQIHLAKVTWASVALKSVALWVFSFQCSQAHSVHDIPDMQKKICNLQHDKTSGVDPNKYGANGDLDDGLKSLQLLNFD